jgi:hypothetical protein
MRGLPGIAQNIRGCAIGQLVSVLSRRSGGHSKKTPRLL